MSNRRDERLAAWASISIIAFVLFSIGKHVGKYDENSIAMQPLRQSTRGRENVRITQSQTNKRPGTIPKYLNRTINSHAMPSHPSSWASSNASDLANTTLSYPVLLMAKAHKMGVFPRLTPCQHWNVLTTRYFDPVPYSGVACFCDWVFKQKQFFGNMSSKPRFIFVEKLFLPIFWQYIPMMSHPFVLISCCHDMTIPTNTDVRYKQFPHFGVNGSAWKMLTTHPNILHWYLENPDMEHPRVSTLPNGMVNHEANFNYDAEVASLLRKAHGKLHAHSTGLETGNSTSTNSSLDSHHTGGGNHIVTTTLENSRPILVLSVDRVRSGEGQWADRERVFLACLKSSFCSCGPIKGGSVGHHTAGTAPSPAHMTHRTHTGTHTGTHTSSSPTASTTSTWGYLQHAFSTSRSSSSSHQHIVGAKQAIPSPSPPGPPGPPVPPVPPEHTHDEFVRLVLSAKFVLMVHGGGLDMCPKAFEVILLGAIPILERSPLFDAYSLLPIAFVDNATDFLLPHNEHRSRATLYRWLRDLGPFYEENSSLRNQTLHRLSTAYWWGRIRASYEAGVNRINRTQMTNGLNRTNRSNRSASVIAD